MLVLPGPGILAIIGGLTLLERDFPWAKRMTDRLKTRSGKAEPETSRRDQAAGG